MTIRTFSLSSVTLEALSDELMKIAAAQEAKETQQSRRDRLKKYLKSTALISAGAGVGYGAGMIAEKAFEKLFGPKWNSLPLSSKLRILGAAAGAASVGALAAREWLAHERSEALK